jgi:hypothetical protein
VLAVGPATSREERAKKQVYTFQAFIEENKDEISALQLFHEQPYGEHRLTPEQIREQADALHHFKDTSGTLQGPRRKIAPSTKLPSTKLQPK